MLINTLIFQVQEWPFVIFYSRKCTVKNMWMEGEILNTVLPEDIKQILDPPDIHLCGTRVYYVFNDESPG